MDEAIALADAGAIVYVESLLNPNVHTASFAFEMYKEGKVGREYIRSYPRPVYVKVETYEP